MHIAFKPSIGSAMRIALSAAIAAGSSAAIAQEREREYAQGQASATVEEYPGVFWRCSARNGHYRQSEGGQSAAVKAISGKLVFHSISPGGGWVTGASIHFMSLATDPDMSHGNGITALVEDDAPDRITIFLVVDGERRRVGSYPMGTPVPFKLTFDDAKGTVMIESGQYSVTAKPIQMMRSHFDMKCCSAEVSFADFILQF